MAPKSYVARIAKRLGIDPEEVTGRNYRRLIREIIGANYQRIGQETTQISSDTLRKATRSLKEGRVVIPRMEEVMPSSRLSVRKAADAGNAISDTLREELSQDLRDTLNEFRTEGGRLAFTRRAGVGAGTMNPELKEAFEKKIRSKMDNYTKKSRGMTPSHVETIARTETRSAVDDIKEQYTERLLEQNPNIKVQKTWQHNKSLSKQPRPHHMAMDGVTVGWRERFRLPNGVIMTRPHDPNAPAEEVINCNCDFQIRMIVEE